MIGLSIYRPNRLRCEDGKERSVMVRSYYDGQRWCWYGDTYFSVPARVRVNGKTIRGIVTNIGEYDSDPTTGFAAFTNDPNTSLIAKRSPAELDALRKTAA